MTAAQYTPPATTVDKLVALRAVTTSDNFVWVMTATDILKLNPTTLATISTHPHGLSSTVDFDAASDDLLYICNDVVGPPLDYYYFIPSTDTGALIDSHATSCVGSAGLVIGSPIGQNRFGYQTGYFYQSYGGAVTGDASAAKIGPLVCPGSPSQIIGQGD
jgi:hypothetical protein